MIPIWNVRCAHFSQPNPVSVAYVLLLSGRHICSKVHEQTQSTVEFDNIALRIGPGRISGYIQFRTGCPRSVLGWVEERATNLAYVLVHIVLSISEQAPL